MEAKKKKKIWIPLVIIGVIVTVIIVVALVIRKKVNDAMAQLLAMPQTAEVRQEEFLSTISATGKVTVAVKEDVVGTLTGVDVKELPVKVGDTVHAGDVICTFQEKTLEQKADTTQFEATETGMKNSRDIQMAQQALEDARAEYDRTIPMLEAEIGRTQHDYEVAASNLIGARTRFQESPTSENQQALYSAESAADANYIAYTTALNNLDEKRHTMEEAIEKADYELRAAKLHASGDTTAEAAADAKEDLTKLTVTAPIDGVIVDLKVQKDTPYGGGTIATIEDQSQLKIVSDIEEYDILKVKEGQEVRITTNATGDRLIIGKVTHVAQKAKESEAVSAAGSSSTPVFEVEISYDQDKEELLAGMKAKLQIVLDKAENALILPYTCLQEEEDGSFFVEVLAETEDEAPAVTTDNPMGLPETRIVPVEKGLESGFYVEVISDELTAGDQVLVLQEEGSDDPLAVLQERGLAGGI